MHMFFSFFCLLEESAKCFGVYRFKSVRVFLTRSFLFEILKRKQTPFSLALTRALFIELHHNVSFATEWFDCLGWIGIKMITITIDMISTLSI